MNSVCASVLLVGGPADGARVFCNSSEDRLRVEYYPPCPAIVGLSHPDSGAPIRRPTMLNYRRQEIPQHGGSFIVQYHYVEQEESCTTY